MATLRTFLKQNVLWGGLMAVIIPLIIIFGMQYWSLSSLQKTSAVAVQVTLRNYLHAVATEIDYFYRTNAEQALTIPLFTPTDTEKVAQHFAFQQQNIQGVKRFFLVPFLPEGEAQVLFYDPTRSVLEPGSGASEMQAVRVACAPWHLMGQEGARLEADTLDVNEQDPDNRIILKPLLDAEWKVIGVAGMILDLAFFRDTYLPQVVAESLKKHMPEGEQDRVIVTVRDGSGVSVLQTQPVEDQDNEVQGMFWFLFKDWVIAIRTRYETPEQWAERQFWINVSLSMLMTGVLIGGIIMTLRMASREMHLSQMKTDFVSNVSHELRTPLASIRVFGEFLRLGRVTEPDKICEYGQYIETESRWLTQLINNILDFSKIESGQKTYRFEPTDVEEVVAETVKLLDVRLSHGGVKLVLDTPPEPLPLVVVDPDALVQALMNLLDNAVKYSGTAKKIQVCLAQTNEELSIAVTDYGIGIPPEQQEKIFDKFYRVGTSLVHEVKGSGLGLSIVQHIAEAHRGHVSVESQPGYGSTFTIHLPITPEQPDAGLAEPTKIAQSGCPVLSTLTKG